MKAQVHFFLQLILQYTHLLNRLVHRITATLLHLEHKIISRYKNEF
jgi:hypothetical protein